MELGWCSLSHPCGCDTGTPTSSMDGTLSSMELTPRPLESWKHGNQKRYHLFKDFMASILDIFSTH